MEDTVRNSQWRLGALMPINLHCLDGARFRMKQHFFCGTAFLLHNNGMPVPHKIVNLWKLPECNLLKLQPSFWLWKLVKQRTWKHGDAMALPMCLQLNSQAQADGSKTTTVDCRAVFALMTVDVSLLRLLHQNVVLLQHYCDQRACYWLFRVYVHFLTCFLICASSILLFLLLSLSCLPLSIFILLPKRVI